MEEDRLRKGGSDAYTVNAMESGAPPNPKILTDEKGFARSDLETCECGFALGSGMLESVVPSQDDTYMILI